MAQIQQLHGDARFDAEAWPRGGEEGAAEEKVSEEKPLSVLVAEALGWTECEEDTTSGRILLPMPSGYYWYGWPPGALPIVGAKRPRAKIPLFEHEWQAAGPLIEKYGINVLKWNGPWQASYFNPPEPDFDADGESPLIAVCNLVLALKAAGRLD